VLNLHTNALTGSIPTQLTSLAALNLRTNALSGTIPTELGLLTNLQLLDLRDNDQLNGSVPIELCELMTMAASKKQFTCFCAYQLHEYRLQLWMLLHSPNATEGDADSPYTDDYISRDHEHLGPFQTMDDPNHPTL
jgi:hypothetical protein